MSTNKFLTILSGVRTLATAIATSAGAGDANKIIATNSSGKLDVTMLPTGVGPTTISVTTSETLAAGDFVNIYNNAGTRNVRKADATNTRPAHGFVLAAVTSGQTATVYQQGENTGLTSLTPGTPMFLGTTAGAATATAPSASGQIVQELGFALSTTSILFEYDGYTAIS